MDEILKPDLDNATDINLDAEFDNMANTRVKKKKGCSS